MTKHSEMVADLRGKIMYLEGVVTRLSEDLAELYRDAGALYDEPYNMECPNCGGTYGAATLGCRCKPEAGND